MKGKSSYLKKIGLINSALLLLVAVLISIFVLQPVSVDTYPGVIHDKIVFIWGVNISINIILAYIMFVITSGNDGTATKVIRGTLMVIIVGLAFVVIDAASSYLNHGPNMKSVSITLFVCAAVYVVVLLLMLSTYFIGRKTDFKDHSIKQE